MVILMKDRTTILVKRDTLNKLRDIKLQEGKGSLDIIIKDLLRLRKNVKKNS